MDIRRKTHHELIGSDTSVGTSQNTESDVKCTEIDLMNTRDQIINLNFN